MSMADVQNRGVRAPAPQPRGPPAPLAPSSRRRSRKDLPIITSGIHKDWKSSYRRGLCSAGKEPKDEVQIYTWRDATLRELTDLVKEVAPAARRRDAKLSFAFVYPDRRGRNVVRQVGVTYGYPNPRRPDEGNKALADLSFQTGDFLDVAILT